MVWDSKEGAQNYQVYLLAKELTVLIMLIILITNKNAILIT